MESEIQMGCLFCFLTVRDLSTQENMSFISKCSMNCSWVGACGWRPGRHLLCSHQSDLETPLLTSPTAWMWYYLLYCFHIVRNKCTVIQTARTDWPRLASRGRHLNLGAVPCFPGELTPCSVAPASVGARPCCTLCTLVCQAHRYCTVLGVQCKINYSDIQAHLSSWSIHVNTSK